MTQQKRIGLVLSGGGIRAMAFHAGVLRHMAEQGELEQVTHLSTVSGGSLVVGLIMQLAGGKWPSSEDYLANVAPRLSFLLTRHRQPLSYAFRCLIVGDLPGATASLRQTFSLQDVIFATGFFLLSRPWAWGERLHSLARAYRHCWGVTTTLGELAPVPEWTINGTSAEYGVRFRFKHNLMGDYKVGYALCSHIPLAEAMAVSSAVPGIFGPYRLPTPQGEWFEWSPSLAQEIHAGCAKPKSLEFDWLDLYDGGVYDNLGLEPFFDCGTQRLKQDLAISHLVVSDAGKPLGPRHLGNRMRSAMRVYDIASNQSRALRVRALSNYLQGGVNRGSYFMIGTDPYALLKQYRPEASQEGLTLSAEDRHAAADYPTHLSRMPAEDFRRVEQHGYETALANELAFGLQQQENTGPKVSSSLVDY